MKEANERQVPDRRAVGERSHRTHSAFSFLGVTVAVGLFAGCGGGAPPGGARTPAHEAPAAHSAVHWGYEGEAGPERWGDLDAAYALCRSGTHQSPIDLSTATPERPLQELALEWHSTEGHMVDNGHTVQVNLEPGNALMIDGTRYELAQIHFHDPSEHTVDGHPAPLEAHFVHRDASGHLAVVGVLLIEADDEVPAYAEILDHVPELPPPAEGHDEGAATLTVNADLPALLPADHSYYAYEGSLTTPPCSEGVHWFVLRHPVAVGRDEVAAFAARYPHNARPVQVLGSREVEADAH